MDKSTESIWIDEMFHLMNHAIRLEETMFPNLSRMHDLAVVMNITTYEMIEANADYPVKQVAYVLPRILGVPVELNESIPDKHVRLIHKTTRFEFAPEMVEGRDT